MIARFMSFYKPGVTHTVKPQKPTANPLPCAAHGKAPRQPGIGKAGLCRVLYIGHTAKGLPCVTIDPRQKKQKTWEVTWRPPLPCACRRGTWQSSNVCRVPWLWHTVNIGFFAVCHGFCTRQRSLILYFLFVYCVYGTPNNTNSSHIS